MSLRVPVSSFFPSGDAKYAILTCSVNAPCKGTRIDRASEYGQMLVHSIENKKTAGFRYRDVSTDLGTNWRLRYLQQKLASGMIKPGLGTELLHFPLGKSDTFLFILGSLGVRYCSTWYSTPPVCAQLGRFQRSKRHEEHSLSKPDRQTPI